MAVQETRTLPAPFIEVAGVTLTEALTPFLCKTIDTAAFAQTGAARSTLQQSAHTAGAGLPTLRGPEYSKP